MIPKGDWRRCWGGRVLHYFLWEEHDVTLCGKQNLTPHASHTWRSSAGYPKCPRCQEKMKESENDTD